MAMSREEEDINRLDEWYVFPHQPSSHPTQSSNLQPYILYIYLHPILRNAQSTERRVQAGVIKSRQVSEHQVIKPRIHPCDLSLTFTNDSSQQGQGSSSSSSTSRSPFRFVRVD